MSAKPQLPVELYRDIVNNSVLEFRDYFNLCFASRALSAEATPLLFKNVEIKTYHSFTTGVRTFTESPRLALFVRSLKLQISRRFVQNHPPSAWWPTYSKLLVNSINNMENLRGLSTNCLWELDTPKQHSHRAWTSQLDLPLLESLHISATLHSPVHQYFKRLPTPLPYFEALGLGAIDIRNLDGITSIRCHQLTFPVNHFILPSLKTLEVQSFYRYPNWNFAPNLETLITTKSSEVPEDLVAWQFTKQLKQVGLVYMATDSQRYLPWLSRLDSLENIVVLRQTGNRPGFTLDDVMVIGGSMPRLQQICVICFEDYAAEILVEKTIQIWKRMPLKAPSMTGVDAQSTWELTTQTMFNVVDGIRALLGVSC